MSDARDEIEAIRRYWTAEGPRGLATKDILALLHEVDRLHALLTAPPDDDSETLGTVEFDAALGQNYST